MDVYASDIEKVLLSADEIQGKLAEMGARITQDYAGSSLLLVGVLKGAFVVMADLARYVHLPLEFDFMAVSSYGAATKTSGVVRILKDLDHELDGRDVLLVEDIVDSGLTLKYLLKNLAARKPASLEVAALLRKQGSNRSSSTCATSASTSPTSSWSGTASTSQRSTGTFRTWRRSGPRRTGAPDPAWREPSPRSVRRTTDATIPVRRGPGPTRRMRAHLE